MPHLTIRGKVYVLVVLLYLPLWGNDLLHMWVSSAEYNLAVDYGTKFLALLGAALAVPWRVVRERYWTPRVSWALAVPLCLASALLVAHPLTNLQINLNLQFPDWVLFNWETVPLSPHLRWFDLAIGLGLTAVVEEWVGRVAAYHLLRDHIRSTWILYSFSAALFALGHWSMGVGAVIVTFVVGLLLMGLFRFTGSVLPVIAVHYLANLIVFY